MVMFKNDSLRLAISFFLCPDGSNFQKTRSLHPKEKANCTIHTKISQELWDYKISDARNLPFYVL